MCQKFGHFTRNCPNKSKKDKMVYHLSLYSPGIGDDDLESLFSLEDNQSPETLLVVDYSNSEKEDDIIEDDYPDILFSLLEINVTNPSLPYLSLFLERPYAKINIFLDYYAKPIPIISFFDIGVARTFINQNLLSPSSFSCCKWSTPCC